MTRRPTRMILLSGILPAIAMLAITVTASADVPANVEVYGSSGTAAGVHVVGGTSQFSSFGDGAINNRYPLAGVGQEAAPASQAVASPADYGPLAATVLASDSPQPLCPPPVPQLPCTVIPFPAHQPPPSTYANAQYPSPPGKPSDSYTSGASDKATASARELGADAAGTYGGDPTAPFSNATAEAHSVLNADGSSHVFTHSHVSSANFGVFAIRNVDVVTDAFSAGGKGRATAVVNPGVIDQGGGKVTVITPGSQGQTITIPSTPPITIRIFTVKPENNTKGDVGSICASGTHVEVDQPSAPGQFSHNIQYILGEGCSQTFVNLAPPAVTTPLVTIDSSGDLTGSTTPGTTTTTTTSFGGSGSSESYTGAPPSAITKAAHTPGTPAHRRVKLAGARVPLPLAAMFFLWEALVLGAAASTVWARRAATVPK